MMIFVGRPRRRRILMDEVRRIFSASKSSTYYSAPGRIRLPNITVTVCRLVLSVKKVKVAHTRLPSVGFRS